MTAADQDLVVELRSSRSEHAIRTLYRSYGRELFGFAVARLGDAESAEELVQDVFERAWRGAEGYDPERGSVRTWLYGIARNRIVDLERSSARRPPPGRGAGPSEAAHEPIEQALLRWQIKLALARLSPEHRTVVRLATVQGYTVREIAEHLRVPEGTVKSRLHYAMQHLRLVLEELGVVP